MSTARVRLVEQAEQAEISREQVKPGQLRVVQRRSSKRRLRGGAVERSQSVTCLARNSRTQHESSGPEMFGCAEAAIERTFAAAFMRVPTRDPHPQLHEPPKRNWRRDIGKVGEPSI